MEEVRYPETAASASAVVLVARGNPEDRHHGVADELLHRAAVFLDPRARISAKYRSVTVRSVSGSSCSPSAVEPVTSANSTVTVLRTSRDPAGSRAAPQLPQNRKPSGLSWPQLGQVSTPQAYSGHGPR